jgi:dethiobiotin synthetase
VSRPERLVLVAGTATEVGKTWVTAAVAAGLRRAGVAVAARKPVQSYEPGVGPTDAEVLAAATGEAVATVCPPHRSLPVPMAPPMAVDVLGTDRFTVSDLVAELQWPAGTAAGFVESVGGVRSPIADDGDTVDLAAAVEPDLVVLVARADLGAVNAVLTTAPLLAAWPTAVLLNRFDADDDVHRRNRAWLADRHGLDVHSAPTTLEVLCRPSFTEA